MTEDRDMSFAETSRELSEQRLRLRDFTILIAISCSVVLLLSLSGALGLIEAVLSMLTIGAGGLAYFVGSVPDTEIPTVSNSVSRDTASEGTTAIAGLVTSIGQPAVVFDAGDRLIAHNQAAKDILRIPTRTRLVAGAILRQPDLLNTITTVRQTKLAETREVIMPYAAEQVWLAEFSFIAPLNGILVILTDHTAVKRAERARADFLANASHELRTPLTSVAGFIETMQGPAKDDKASWDRFLDIMHAQTQRMSRLIGDLLSLSRIELDEHRRPDSSEDLYAMANDAVDALRPVASERAIDLVLHKPEAATPVMAIRDEIIQVVQNLTDNAIKYSKSQDKITLTIGVAPDEDIARARSSRRWEDGEGTTIYSPPPTGEVKSVWLRVEDRGQGIDAEHLPRLGERFYRADKSRGGEVSGTGLGLAIVKHIMTRHEGGFAVESIPGKGTAFGIWLPIRSQNPSRALQS